MSDEYPPDVSPEVERALDQVRAIEGHDDRSEFSSSDLLFARIRARIRGFQESWALPAFLASGVLALVLVLVINGNGSRFIMVVTIGAALGGGALFTISAVLRYFAFRNHLHRLDAELRELYRIRSRYIELAEAEQMRHPGERPPRR